MAPESKIPKERLERNPLMTIEGWCMFEAIRQDAHAPIWNYEVGDRGNG